MRETRSQRVSVEIIRFLLAISFSSTINRSIIMAQNKESTPKVVQKYHPE